MLPLLLQLHNVSLQLVFKPSINVLAPGVNSAKDLVSYSNRIGLKYLINRSYLSSYNLFQTPFDSINWSHVFREPDGLMITYTVHFS